MLSVEDKQSTDHNQTELLPRDEISDLEKTNCQYFQWILNQWNIW